MEQITNYKSYRKYWNKCPKEYIVLPFPLHLDIELNTDCPLSCEPCPNHSPNARYPPLKNEHMNFNLYKKIIDEGSKKGLCSVKLSFRGEPLLYQKLPEAIIYARQKGIIDVRLNSNGLLLDKALTIQLISSGLTRFILSDYDILEQCTKVLLLQDMKRLFHTETPVLVVKTENPKRWQGLADEITKHIFHDYNSGEECFETSEFECEQLYQRLVILADGRVKVCCSSVMFEDGIIGDVNENTIEELWNGEYMEYIRFCHKNHRANLIESCRHCPGVIEFVRDNKKIKRGVDINE